MKAAPLDAHHESAAPESFLLLRSRHLHHLLEHELWCDPAHQLKDIAETRTNLYLAGLDPCDGFWASTLTSMPS
jgi:hypothetical protein